MKSPTHLASKPLRRELELDFIRGIAILLVIDFHSPGSPIRPFFLALGFQDHIGWVGVDIFFVLSGFLVGGLLMKEWKVRRGIDSTRFLIRRGFKIWPQYYLFLAVLLLTGQETVHFLWGNLLNIQNYVGGVAHTWSLAVEEHAYLLLTLCMAIAARRRATVRGLFLFLLTVCLLEIPFRYFLVMTGHLVFLPTHARIDSIGYGVLLAMLFHFAPERFSRLRSKTWLWLLCLLISVVALRQYNAPAFFLATSHDAATLLGISVLLLLYRPLPPGRTHNLLYRAVAWIGLYSYGIYLWHVSLVGPTEKLMARQSFIPASLTWIVIRLAEIAVGVLTTGLCEIPALHLRDRLFPRRVDSAVGTPALQETADPASAHL
ncbi:MAG TPA: acyltransferase [Acidobacteriaceae bacterium]|nr:acyltransferase [Acidobacteriaceae bacterium]